MTEIIRMLPGEGIEEGQDYIASIPEGVRNAIGRRLNKLSEGCNWVLTIASVIGREFDFKLLNALRDDLTEASLLELVDEALAAHVIEELPEGRDRYQFGHARCCSSTKFTASTGPNRTASCPMSRMAP